MAIDLQNLKAHFRRAERAIKRCERVTLAVPVPALNQLRYAGNHLLKALTAEQEDVAAAEAEKAELHTKRAWFDAFDSIAAAQLDAIRSFADKGYPLEIVLQYIPTYEDDLAYARKVYPLYCDFKAVQDMSVAERLRRIRESARLRAFMRALAEADGELGTIRARIEEENRRRANRRDFVSTLASLSASVLGTVFSAAGLLATEKTWAIVAGWIGVSIFTVLAIVSIVMVVWSVLDSTHKTSWNIEREQNASR
jgi:hypothetical protein